MNAKAQVYEQYKKTSVETVSSGKLLLMLYDGCIRNIEKAKNAVEEKNPQKAHEHIIKAQDIVIELMATLNMDYDISRRLMTVYDYIYNQMVEANVKKDTDLLEEIRSFLFDLRITWEGAMNSIHHSPVDSSQARGNFIITG